MFSRRSTKIEIELGRGRFFLVLARRTACIALLAAGCSAVSMPAALAQTGPTSRIAVQGAKPKMNSQGHKPLESDALYICTLSGFGNLAHCYPR